MMQSLMLGTPAIGHAGSGGMAMVGGPQPMGVTPSGSPFVSAGAGTPMSISGATGAAADAAAAAGTGAQSRRAGGVSPAVPMPAGAPGGVPLALAGLPVWEKAAVLQQAIREGWPQQQVQMVLASLSDEEIAAIRMVHSQQMAAGGAGAGAAAAAIPPAGAHVAPAAAAAAARPAPKAAAKPARGGGAAAARRGDAVDADAIIESAALEAVAAAAAAGSAAAAARAMVAGGGGSGSGRGRGEADDRAAFSIDDLRDLKGHLLDEATLGSPPGSLPPGAVERSFDSLSLPSIHDQGARRGAAAAAVARLRGLGLERTSMSRSRGAPRPTVRPRRRLVPAPAPSLPPPLADGWADLLRDLRRVSSTSHSNPSFNMTDWIPEAIGRCVRV
jgi:hypothetical protein